MVSYFNSALDAALKWYNQFNPRSSRDSVNNVVSCRWNVVLTATAKIDAIVGFQGTNLISIKPKQNSTPSDVSKSSVLIQTRSKRTSGAILH